MLMGVAPGQAPTPKGGGGGLYGPHNGCTEQGASSAPAAPEILFWAPPGLSKVPAFLFIKASML